MLDYIVGPPVKFISNLLRKMIWMALINLMLLMILRLGPVRSHNFQKREVKISLVDQFVLVSSQYILSKQLKSKPSNEQVKAFIDEHKLSSSLEELAHTIKKLVPLFLSVREPIQVAKKINIISPFFEPSDDKSGLDQPFPPAVILSTGMKSARRVSEASEQPQESTKTSYEKKHRQLKKV